MTPRSARGEAVGSGVQYGLSRDAFSNYEVTLKELLQSNRCGSVCEVGGGANPALPLDYVSARGLRYCVLDVAEEELAKAPVGYEKITADICGARAPAGGPFDFVFSKMLAEHVRRPRTFHKNIRSLLRPGGLAFHFFPTLYAFPFLVNLLLPERAAAQALRLFSPRDPIRHGKFPAYYRWCRGPTATQRRRFEQLGYVVEQYIGFFGHGYYERIPVLRGLQRWGAEYLARHPVALLTSFAYLVLRKTNVEPEG